MIKIVLDTNVLVSALIKPDSKPELILRLIFSNLVKLCLSQEIFDEYREVLKRDKFRKGLRQTKVVQYLKLLKDESYWVAPQERADLPMPDPDDGKFLVCALEAEADFLITGNAKHFPHSLQNTRVVSPDAFIAIAAEKLF